MEGIFSSRTSVLLSEIPPTYKTIPCRLHSILYLQGYTGILLICGTFIAISQILLRTWMELAWKALPLSPFHIPVW